MWLDWVGLGLGLDEGNTRLALLVLLVLLVLFLTSLSLLLLVELFLETLSLVDTLDKVPGLFLEISFVEEL